MRAGCHVVQKQVVSSLSHSDLKEVFDLLPLTGWWKVISCGAFR